MPTPNIHRFDEVNCLVSLNFRSGEGHFDAKWLVGKLLDMGVERQRVHGRDLQKHPARGVENIGAQIGGR